MEAGKEQISKIKMNPAVKLTANENCYGCSPLALEAIEAKYKDVHLYPDVNPVALKAKLSEKFGVGANSIVVGAGSVRIIDGLIQTFVGHDEEVLTFEKSFVAYSQLAGIHKRKCIFAPLTHLRCAPGNLLPFINDKTRLIFIANPNNPTGTIISHTELENLLKNIPGKIIVAIDEAYSEYVIDSSFPDSIQIQKEFSNLVILRTFSKVYGLAGLRIGYGIMDEKLSKQMSEGQIPYSLNYLSPGAALAALQDEGFVIQSSKANAEQRDYLYNEFKKLGYNTIPSQANFIYLWFDNEVEKKKVFDLLLQNGIIICDMKIFGQEKSLRITVGKQEVNARIIELLAGAS